MNGPIPKGQCAQPAYENLFLASDRQSRSNLNWREQGNARFQNPNVSKRALAILASTECVLVAEYVVNEGTQETGTA